MNDLFTLALGLTATIFATLVVIRITNSEPSNQPTVKCIDGKLYDVSYEGNITIIQERPFTTCEER